MVSNAPVLITKYDSQLRCRSRPSVILTRFNIPQNAAGTLAYLISSGVPRLRFSLDDEERPSDLTEPFAKSLEWLMLAQAQECVWQRAVMGEWLTRSIVDQSMIPLRQLQEWLGGQTCCQCEILRWLR